VTIGEDAYMNVWEITTRESNCQVSLISSTRVGDEILTGVVISSATSVQTASYDVCHLKSWHAK